MFFSFRIRRGRKVQLAFFFFLSCIDLDELPQAQFFVSRESSQLHMHVWTLVKRVLAERHVKECQQQALSPDSVTLTNNDSRGTELSQIGTRWLSNLCGFHHPLLNPGVWLSWQGV